ncbi:MAG: LamG domain-containing protein [Candidatus Rokubacteria bacterium]|nr:LamG domain-containing protein [Candidatus Rokubacteria bacterium]
MSWWPGDGDANDIQGDNDGTLQNGASFSAGKVGQAFSFDGVDDYVLVPDAANLDLTSGMTIDAWVNPATINMDDGAAIVAKGEGTGEAYLFDVSDATGGYAIRFLFRDSTGLVFGVGFEPWLTLARVGVWNHVAGTYDAATGVSKLYIDGVHVSTGVAPPNTLISTNTHELSIGSRQFRGGAYDLNFNGLIDEVEIFDRALSASEIQAIFNAGSAGKCKVTIVTIDIKPGSFPNSINPRSRGVIPLAILTTDSFDATTVDSTTVLFGPTGAEAAPVRSALEDVDLDGDTDMILHFNTQDTRIQCGDTSASLTGQTISGQALEGADSIKTAGCK